VLSFLIAVAVSAVSAFFALVYFKNVIMKDKLKMFVYYCFDAAAIAFIIAIING
jgi:undecaprenyl pyrophosphate phosphatase UppP